MRLLFGLAALLAAGAAHAQAVDVTKATPPASIMLVSAAYGSYPAVISFEGIIGLKVPARLADAVTASNVQDGHAIIFLRSLGGLSDCAIDIGRFNRRHGFDTAVDDRKLCTSACAIAWLGGVRRFVGKGARIGFHSTQDTFPDGRKERSVYGNKRVATYLVGLGYPDGLADYISAPEPWSMRYLTGDAAAMYHIVDDGFAAGSTFGVVGTPVSPLVTTGPTNR